MKIIRASELNTYKYCQRAWWYQKKGYIPDNLSILQDGEELHHRHGQSLFITRILKFLAYGLITVGFLLVIIYLAAQFG